MELLDGSDPKWCTFQAENHSRYLRSIAMNLEFTSPS